MERKLVDIMPCKECGIEYGYQLENQIELAECKNCQHLCDVTMASQIGFNSCELKLN
tara:strand:- start:272 stop:442 length:171 start_codon:yes stop_codon:yes gene_type:complete